MTRVSPLAAARTLLAAITVAAFMSLAGCVGGIPGRPASAGPAAQPWPVGVHPWPSPDTWPSDLAPPFELAQSLHVRVPGFDGTLLDGQVYRPAVPPDVRVPVILMANPYFGQILPAVEDVGGGAFVESGYALALFNVRGSGRSEGCYELFGRGEQQDLVQLVEWLAVQPWSSGRVGMTGLSYEAITGLMAAVQNPPSLKAIVGVGLAHDIYQSFHTPQGAAAAGDPMAAFVSLVSLAPSLYPLPLAARGDPMGASDARALLEGQPDRIAQQAAVMADRACPGVAQAMTEEKEGAITERRDPTFWSERRLTEAMQSMTAATYFVHGFQDATGRHQWQDDIVWPLLANAPRRLELGQWGHEYPTYEGWMDRQLAWFDFWLKGLGQAPPGWGEVAYEDDAGVWRVADAWPPPDSRRETLYLGGGRLLPAAEGPGASWRSLALPAGARGALCGMGPGLAAVFYAEPLPASVLLAGNPVAVLSLTSDEPGGLLSIHLFDVPPHGPTCSPTSTAEDSRLLGRGVADLRFYEGGYAARPFATGVPVTLRVDLPNLAARIDAGHRMAVVLSWGDPNDRLGQPYGPSLQVGAGSGQDGSYLVLPVLEGTLGGNAPTWVLPPRPFEPVPGPPRPSSTTRVDGGE